jgi:UDPglucose 6-dehydrogenase
MGQVKIAVIGEGHLADATRTCVYEHFDRPTATDLGHLIWYCVDTPVDENDIPNAEFVRMDLAEWIPEITPGTPILISSQLPVGTCAQWEKEWPEHCLIVQPENIRKAHAVEDFMKQDRMICGVRSPWLDVFDHKRTVEQVLSNFTDVILWMSPESAEMTKHALNTWLAMNIAYANEIADICKLVGADLDDVFGGFRSDARVSGPLVPGGPYTGGTLGRDVQVLLHLEGIGQHFPFVIKGVDTANRYKVKSCE